MSILDHMTTAEYMKLRYGNRRPRRWWGTAHRHWLLSSGRYIKTSEQRSMGLMQFMGRVPEPYEPDYVGSWGKRLEQLRASTYPHHKGTAIGMGDKHWPGCGCPEDPMNREDELDALTCHCGRIACRHHQEEP